MSTARVFYLRFCAPVRLGASARDAGDAARDFPSDTLSSALVVAAAELHGGRVGNRTLGDIAREPPWVVSSLLPWVDVGGRLVRFFPRAVDCVLGAADEAKAYRKVAYISAGLLNARGATPVVSGCGTLAATPEETDAAFGAVLWQRRATRPSVTVDRVTAATSLFHLEEVAMGMGSSVGVWVLVRTNTDDDMTLFRGLLAHLSDAGIGADRARGYGRFEVVQHLALALDEATRPARRRMLLGYASPDAPLSAALEDAAARYVMVRREGRAHGARGGLGLLRRALRLLGPGSVLPDCGPVVGRTRDITPDGFHEHRIWRDGRTLAWPLPEALA